MDASSTDTKSSGRPAAARWRRPLILGLVFSGSYYLIYRSTNVLAYSDLSVSPWNPETGLLLAAGFFGGWAGVALAFVVHLFSHINLSTHLNLPVEFVSATMHACFYAAPAALAGQKFSVSQFQISKVLLALIVWSTVASIMVAATQVGIFSLAGALPLERPTPAIITLAVGDLIGILTVAPPLLLLSDPFNFVHYLKSSPAAAASLVLMAAVVAVIVFGLDSTDHFKFFYLVFIPVIAFAMLHGVNAAMLGILASDTFMMSIIYLRDFSVSTATELQILMLSLAATGLLLGAVVSDRRRIEQQLEHSHAQLQASQSSLLQATRRSLVSEMAAALAHEINQPLTAARNYIRAIERMLGKVSHDPQKLRELVKEAVTQIDGASDLIRETRSFLERGDTPFMAVDISAIIDPCVRMIEPECRAAGIQVTFSRPPKRLVAMGNKTQLQQIVMNLLRNSIDSLVTRGRPPRTIAITAERADIPGMIAVTVTDSGPGLRDVDQTKLFIPLTSSKPNGLGLGLSLCKSIATAHGGDISLVSSEPGAVSFRFTFRESSHGVRP